MFIEPVFGKKFFGREEVLGTLQKRVTALKGGYRQNLALTGPMLAGKSSILRHFLNDIKDPDIIPLYIEMGEDDFLVFSRRFMATLLFRYLNSIGMEATGDFEDLKSACSEIIPETMQCIDKINKSLKQKKNDIAYEGLLALTSVFKTETGKSCIVILDEFHNLSNFKLKKPFQTFGKFIMVQKNTMYVVSSSQQTLLKEILSKKLSLLFGNFEVIQINGFDNQTARSFLSDKVKGIKAEETINNYLVQISQGNPFYLEVLADRFSELARSSDGNRSTKECLLEALAEIVYASGGVLNQYFTNNINFFLEKKTRKKFIPVLLALAKGKSTIKEIQGALEKTDKDLGKMLQKLGEMDLVWNSGVFYKISDKLFEYWLKYVYGIKAQSMIDDLDIKYLEFKHAIEKDYKAYCAFSLKSISSIISDLFRSFRGEKVRVRMNCRKLPHFDSVKERTAYSNVIEIVGKLASKEWICRVKKADITDEHDIYDLWELKPKDENSKIVRKVFIPLKGIEQNAFLLAKEQNIWVWDIQLLNKMLRIFGKFELVL